MTFSGGGFRAAAFSLGTLAYLDRLCFTSADMTAPGALLSHVSFISSASGGTITNALYSAYKHQGKSFRDVYDKLLKELSGEQMLEAAMNVLNTDSEWRQAGNEKRRNLINAFAKVYDRVLFEGETFARFRDKTHVQNFEVCFNSTEFYRGLSFRFQTEGMGNKNEITGNKYLHFDVLYPDVLDALKLADILAASSCFPMGFEPIVYPEDFTYEDSSGVLTKDALLQAMACENYQEEKKPLKVSFGLMDGGITDNQGLYSVMLADKKRRSRIVPTPFDLIIVTDVGSYFIDAYRVPEEETESVWRRKNIAGYLKMLKNISKATRWITVAGSVILLASLACIFLYKEGILKNVSYISSGLLAIILGIRLLLGRVPVVRDVLSDPSKIDIKPFLQRSFHLDKYFSENVINKLINFFQFTRVGVLKQMLKARIASAMLMVSEINLKQTRRLIYEMFYDDPSWDNRRMPNFIYELSIYNIKSRTNRFKNPYRLKWVATEEDKELLLSGCEKMNTVAEDARLMGTTLWFDQLDSADEKLKKIISAGQFTTCANLLEYIISIERKKLVFEPQVQISLEKVKHMLIKDWLDFKENPHFVYEGLI